MRVDEVGVEIDGLLVVLGCLGEFTEEEMELRAVIVNIGIGWVVLNRSIEIIPSSFASAFITEKNLWLAHCLLPDHRSSKDQMSSMDLPDSKCKVARLT